MNINMDNSTYEKLISLSRSNKNEISGYLLDTKEGQDFYVTSIELQSDETIKSSSQKHIDFNMKNYLTDLIFRMHSLGESKTLICFHSHPSLRGSINLSESDINMLRQTQRIADKVANSTSPDDKITVVEGVVNLRDVAFHTIDQTTDRVVRLPLFVEGIEITPSEESTFFQSIKKGFKIGRKKGELKSRITH